MNSGKIDSMWRYLGLLPLLLLVNTLVSAQGVDGAFGIPSRERGIQPGKTSSNLAGIDAINRFNGNLSMALPIGPSVPIDGGLSYQLQLNYNSQIWDAENYSCNHQETNGDVMVRSFTSLVPEHLSNAGLGWTVSMGHFLPRETDETVALYYSKPVYVAPDGAQHRFYQISGGGNYWFTRNGSYLRLQEQSSCQFTNGDVGPFHGSACKRIEFPNGQSHFFRNIGDAAFPDWRLVRIRDKFGNQVRVKYYEHAWEIVKGGGESYSKTTVSFDTSEPDYEYGKVTKITTPKPQGADAAEYDFTYQTREVARHRYQHEGMAGQMNCLNTPTPPPTQDILGPNVTIEVLSNVELPNGRSFSFDYDLNDSGSNKSGAIKSYSTPAGASYEYDYAEYIFGFSGSLIEYPGYPNASGVVTSAVGVGEKRLKNGSTTTRRWQYDQRFRATGGLETITTSVIQEKDIAEGETRYTWYYFTVDNPNGNFLNGLPVTFDGGAPSEGPDNSRISVRYFGSTQPSFSLDHMFDPDVTPLQEVYLDYDYDSPMQGPSNAANSSDHNFRVRFQHTRRSQDTVDDVARFKQELKSNYAGYGRYRKSVTSSNYRGDAANNQTINFTNYSNVGLTQSAWLLNLYNYIETEDITEGESSVLRTMYSFNTTTGFLNETRLQRNPGCADAPNCNDNRDLIRAFASDGNGNLNHIFYRGGDDNTPHYRIKQEYKYGVVEKAFFTTCASTVHPVLHTINEEFVSTWSPVYSEDEAGVKTRLSFDNMWRPTTFYPQGAPGVRVFYDDAARSVRTVSCPERWDSANEVWSHDPCNAGYGLQQKWYVYDYLGRLVREAQEYGGDAPGSNDILDRFTVYDNRNRIEEEDIDWDDPAANNNYSNRRIKYVTFDDFDRPLFVTFPDGRQVRYTYTGERITKIEYGNPDGNDTREVIQYTDAKGRLYRVEEQSMEPPAISQVATDYKYNVHGQITEVCLQPGSGNSCSQRRTFNYDGRGLLTHESHPEINGSYTYRYDALGNVIQRNSSGHSRYLKYQYDAAARLTKVFGEVDTDDNPTTPPVLSVLREFQYARENGPSVGFGPNRSAGKLVAAKQHNWVRIFDEPGEPLKRITITEQLRFDFGGFGVNVGGMTIDYGRSGRTRLKRMISSTGDVFDLEATSYNRFGQLAAMRLPALNQQSTLLGGQEVEWEYQIGRLRGVKLNGQDVISSIVYSHTGQPASLHYANGVIYNRHFRDGSSWNPLSGISTSNVAAGQNLDLNPISYDSRGHIRSVGQETGNYYATYNYDKVDRLQSSTTRVAGTNHTQNLDYDVAGNITRITYDGQAVFPQPDLATNRASGLGIQYDSNGNIVQYNVNSTPVQLTYDHFNRVRWLTGPTVKRSFLYNAAGERVATLDFSGTERRESWTPRGLNNSVLTRLVREGSDQFNPQGNSQQAEWFLDRLYVTNGDYAIAARRFEYDNGEVTASTEYFHHDHLGSVRLITDEGGNPIERRDYYPFGELIGSPVEGGEEFQFTGHERDANPDDLTGRSDLDYMLARYYMPHVGRFLSPDPVQGTAGTPQRWNRFTYALNNPIRLIDPDGRDPNESLVQKIQYIGGGAGVADAANTYNNTRATQQSAQTTLTEARTANAQAQSAARGGFIRRTLQRIPIIGRFFRNRAAERVAAGTARTVVAAEQTASVASTAAKGAGRSLGLVGLLFVAPDIANGLSHLGAEAIDNAYDVANADANGFGSHDHIQALTDFAQTTDQSYWQKLVDPRLIPVIQSQLCQRDPFYCGEGKDVELIEHVPQDGEDRD